MATRPDRYPFERALRRFEAIVHQAQRTILAQIEAAVKAGDLSTAGQRRAQLSAITRTLAELSTIAQPLASRLVRDAWHQGAERALAQVRKLSISTAEIPGAFSGISREGVEALQTSLMGRLDDASQTLGRRVEDIYAREQRYASLRAILGAEGSPHAASEQLQVRLLHDATIRKTVRESNVGFVDRSGKRWSLENYANMATRTVTREAVVHGAVARMASHGIAIARVSTHPGSCEICLPFQGTLVALSPDAPLEWKGEAVSDTGATPPFHPNCLVAGTRVQADSVYGALRASYSGPVIDLATASGVRLTVTPNHPVMTSAGWLPAGELREGQHVFRRAGGNWFAVEQHDLDDMPAPVEQVFDALDAHGRRALTAAASDDLHGDARCIEGEVDVVLADRLLLDELASSLSEQRGESALERTDVEALGLTSRGAPLQLVERTLRPAHRRVGRVRRRRPDCDAVLAQALGHRARCYAGVSGEPLDALAGEVAGGIGVDVHHIDQLHASHRLTPRSQLHATLQQLAAHADLSRAELARQLRDALPSDVEADQLVGVERRRYAGHVYDLSTAAGMYEAESLIISNCAHSLMPVSATIQSLREELEAEPEGAPA